MVEDASPADAAARTRHHRERAAQAAPRVSIIIPAYNAAATLERALESAAGQTETDVEIIVVDDASDDATWEVASRFQDADPRLRLERFETNRGKSYAMNHATRLARGTWIALLDADDWYAPDRIEQLVDAAEAGGVEMAADNVYFIDNHAGLCTGIGFPFQQLERLVDLDAFLQMSDPTARYDYGMLKPVFRADFLREHALEYFERARIGEDFYILLCFFAAGGRGILIDTPLYFYLEPFGSVSRQWAQPTRSRYKFESMLQTHDHFANLLAPGMERRQQRLLARRRAGIEAMVRLYQLYECAKTSDFRGVFKRVARATPSFWTVVGKKLLARVQGMTVRAGARPIPKVERGDAGHRRGATPPERWRHSRVAAGTVVKIRSDRRASHG